MDYEKSVYTTHDNNEPDEITNLVINDEKIDEFDIFRLKDDPIPVFITSALKSKLDDANCTGIKFIDSKDLTVG